MPSYYDNGEYATTESSLIFDRGFTLGDGCFETVLLHKKQPVGLDAHITRLCHGLHILDIPLPKELTHIEQIIHNLCEHACQTDGVIRITVSRGLGGRGLAFTKTMSPHLVVTLSPLPSAIESLTACTAFIKRNESSPLSQIKSLNYLDNILSLADAQKKGFSEALFYNHKGNPVCFTAGNLLIVTDDGKLYTPSPETGCLRGTTLLTIKEKLHYKIIMPDDLHSAKHIFRVNSVFSFTPVLQINDIKYAKGEL